MKKNLTFTLSIAFISLCFCGCVIVNFMDFNSISGKGNPESFEILVDSYNRIRVEGYCDIRYYASSRDTVTLEIQPNLREYYTIEVVGDELVVRTIKRISFSSSITPVLSVYTPILDRVTIEGVSNFTTNDKITSSSFSFALSGTGNGKAELDVGSLYVMMSGAGDLELSGRADTVDFRLSGAGEMDALPLQSREATIYLSGTGTIRINSSEALHVNASGTGTVVYAGSPSLTLNNSGLVTVRKAD